MFFISGFGLKGRNIQLNVHGNWMGIAMVLRKELEHNINNIFDNQKNIDEQNQQIRSYEKELDLGFLRRNKSKDPNFAARGNLIRGLLLNLYLLSINLE